MPCFKGLAVSIHSDGALPEYSIQKQSKFSRITSYISVPPPKLNTDSGKPEQCSFAVSITLLTPGMAVPYSTPKPTDSDPFPRPQIVGGLPGLSSMRTSYATSVKPYEPLTSSPNETIAAYIYFDGRKKEEVATLLRRGEETWVNSRWVSVPELEGGGLAERDFLFREVGLERWLNGLDLKGHDVAAKVKRRREKMEKKRRKRDAAIAAGITPGESGDEASGWRSGRPHRQRGDDGILRYGANDREPLERPSDDEDDAMSSSSESDSDDDPIPESAGQIKVALFRVLASGEIKKGEYSPQFDAHDDDDDDNKNGDGDGADIDHTTSFAKPKTLDPKTISTQTVTGIDGPDKPFAVFTFLYRGEKQLQKMGILKSKKAAVAAALNASQGKRSTMGTDFANLKPLQPGGTIGFTGVREESSPTKNGKGRSIDEMDSDDEEDVKPAAKDEEEKDDFKSATQLSAEELRKGGELADGVKKIKLKRQHSFEPEPAPGASTATTFAPHATQHTPTADAFPTLGATSPPLLPSAAYDPIGESGSGGGDASAAMPAAGIIGSPLKKQRASVSAAGGEAGVGVARSSADAVAKGLGFGFVGDVSGSSGGELGVDIPKIIKTEAGSPKIKHEGGS